MTNALQPTKKASLPAGAAELHQLETGEPIWKCAAAVIWERIDV